jgi:hypothetical protein
VAGKVHCFDCAGPREQFFELAPRGSVLSETVEKTDRITGTRSLDSKLIRSCHRR